jgi:hypothetical protein
MHEMFCRGSAARVPMHEMFCRGSAARAPMHEMFCRGSAARAPMHEMFCRGSGTQNKNCRRAGILKAWLHEAHPSRHQPLPQHRPGARVPVRQVITACPVCLRFNMKTRTRIYLFGCLLLVVTLAFWGLRCGMRRVEIDRIKRMNPHDIIGGGTKPLVIYAFTELGMNPNELNSDGENVLFEAVRQGDAEVIAALVASGADVNHVNKNGESLRDVASRLTAADEITRILFGQNEPHKPAK